MIGYRNKLIILATLGCQTLIAYAAVANGTDMVGLATVLGAVGATAVGGVYGRGYNKKHAPEG